MNDGPPVRKTPAHGPSRQPEPGGIQFVTVCTKNRKKILANDSTHGLILDAWASARDWIVGRYVIMPNHIHLFCAEAGLNSHSLESWIRFWKSHVAKRWPDPKSQPIWQDSHWDTRMRSPEDFASKWEYVRENPVRAGMVARPEEWPFAGEIVRLDV